MSDLPFPDDELLSSFLDGEATAEERARVDARLTVEPDLVSRLDALRAAAELTATPVTPLGDDDREQLLGAALAASATSPNVTDLATSRHRLDPWRTRLVGVAAAVIALAIAVPALRALDRPESETDASATGPADDAALLDDADGTADEMAPAETLEGEHAPTEAHTDGSDVPSTAARDAAGNFRGLVGPTVGFDPLPDELGEFGDLASVRAAARTAWNDAAEAVGPTADDTTVPSTVEEDPAAAAMDLDTAAAFLNQYGGCGEALEAVAGYSFTTPPVAVDYAAVQIGADVFTVGLFALSDGSGVLLVLDTNGCTITDAEALPSP